MVTGCHRGDGLRAPREGRQLAEFVPRAGFKQAGERGKRGVLLGWKL